MIRRGARDERADVVQTFSFLIEFLFIFFIMFSARYLSWCQIFSYGILIPFRWLGKRLFFGQNPDFTIIILSKKFSQKPHVSFNILTTLLVFFTDQTKSIIHFTGVFPSFPHRKDLHVIINKLFCFFFLHNFNPTKG